MSTKIKTRALFSGDGEKWNNDTGQELVSKIVVGKPPNKGEAEVCTLEKTVLVGIAKHWQTLTHLYLWGVTNVDDLLEQVGKEWPPNLKTLDLRGCPLAELPALPDTLEDLDLGGCAELAEFPKNGLPNLRRLYLDGCVNIPGKRIGDFLEDCEALEEFDASECGQITSLTLPKQSAEIPEAWLEAGGHPQFPPKRLKKLVLEGCSGLTSLPDLSGYPWLHHVNLQGCSVLEELPDLPESLQYLLLHGAERLTRFRGQGIGAYDRGEEGANVAARLLSRRKFGADLDLSAHAKLLLLGDGRVGKSTLAKCLQWHVLLGSEAWESADEDQKKEWEDELKPHDKESPTHKMRVWDWKAPLCLDEERLEKLKEEAASAGLDWPKVEEGDLSGQVGIWDFGGQEIYHNTHRVFAREGAVFLVVWDPEEPDQNALEEERPNGYPVELWRELNTRRPLDYWLDYVYSMNPSAQVALVCGRGRTDTPDWRSYAPRHEERELQSFFFDSCAEDCLEIGGYKALCSWLKKALGREADERVGIIQPRFFAETASGLGRMLEENSKARNQGQQAENLLLTWSNWEERLKKQHQEKSLGEDLSEGDFEAITGYLKDAGHLMVLAHGEERGILVDQSWGTSLIYEILKPNGEIHQRIVDNGGWFARAEMENEAEWKVLASDLQREQLLRFMEDSGVLVPFVPDGKETLYIANEKWLLPKEERLDAQMKRRLNLVAELPDAEVEKEFSFEEEDISEFEFRRLMAWLGRLVGTRALWFRRGMQVMAEGSSPGWCFRIRWQEQQGAFHGKVDAQLYARQDLAGKLVEEIEEIFSAKECPLARHRIVRNDRQTGEFRGDLSEFYFYPVEAGKERVGISSRGADGMVAQELEQALKDSGIATRWYRDEECRQGEYAKVFPFMKELGKSEVIIIYLSDDYLDDDPEVNWYCLWELADAIIKLADNTRPASKTLVIYKPGDGVDSKNLDEKVAPLLKKMAEYFDEKYSSKDVMDKPNFKDWNSIAQHFVKAYQDGRVGTFFAEKGTLGTYDRIPEADGKRDYSGIIDSVKRALE